MGVCNSCLKQDPQSLSIEKKAKNKNTSQAVGSRMSESIQKNISPSNRSKESFRQPNSLYSSKSSISSSLIENNSPISFYHLPSLFNVEEFDLTSCTEEELITKSDWLYKEIKEVKTYISHLETRLGSLDPEENEQTEKVIIHIGNCTIIDLQVGKKYQVSIQQKLDSLLKSNFEESSITQQYFENLSTVKINQESFTAEYQKFQLEKSQTEHKEVDPGRLFCSNQLPVVKALGKEYSSHKRISMVNKKDFLASAVVTKTQKMNDSLLESTSLEKEVFY